MELEQGMTVEQCLIKLGVSREGVLAVQQGGRVLEMNAPVTQPGLLHLLTMHTEEGRRIYERSVRFLLLAATNRVLPGQRVRIEYSVSGGVLLRMPGHTITEEETRAIARQMHALAAQNLPFEKKEWTLDDAIAYFDAQGQADKVALLSRRTTPFFHMYGLDGMWEYFYGAMATRTGMTQVFELTWLPTAASFCVCRQPITRRKPRRMCIARGIWQCLTNRRGGARCWASTTLPTSRR